MNLQRIKHSFFILLSLILLLWALIAILFFMNNLSKIERMSTEATLICTTKSNATQVRQVFNRYQNSLQITATALEAYDDFSSPEALSYLNRVAKIEGFEHLTLNYTNGRIITLLGETLYQVPTGWVERIQQGEPFILDVIDPHSKNTSQVSVLVPLHDKKGEIVAALRCDFSFSELSKLFDATFSNAGGYFCMIDGNGNYISVSNSPDTLLSSRSFFQGIDMLTYEDGYSADQIKRSFFLHQEGFTKYTYEGKHRYAYHLPIGINNWVLFMVIPKETIEIHANQHKSNSLILSAQIVIIFSIFLFFVYFSQKKEKSVALLHERYLKALEEQTGKVIFEWDFATGKMTCLSDFQSAYGRFPFTHSTAEDSLSLQAIHEDDHELFHSLFQTILQGEPVSDIRFRILNCDGTYLWSSLSAVVVKNPKNCPFKAIAILENIDPQVRKEHDLRYKAEMDGLTSLFNKSTTEHLVKNALERWRPGDSMCALMIDVDNFKEVNDSFGHLYGDMVLTSLAKHLKHSFSPDDIIGRIGGDEFFVFMQNYSSLPRLISKAEKLRNCFRNTYEENDMSVPISASIGIAIFPEHGNDFDSLYKHADIALYTSKAQGKDTFRIFDRTNCADFYANSTAIDPTIFVKNSSGAPTP